MDSVDTGETETVLDMNGFSAIYSEDNDGLSIVIYNDNIIITLVCSDKEFDITEFAESVKAR